MAMLVVGNVGSNLFDPDYLKLTSNLILSYAYDAVSEYPEPNRDDYQTEEEYKEAYKNYLLFLVDYVNKIKHNIFSDVLDTYNETLSFERNIHSSIDALNNKLNGDIAYCNRNIRHGIISTVICSLVFPVKMIPIFLGLGVGRYLINKSRIKRCMTVSQQQKAMLQQFDKDKESIYSFQDFLRDDYHSKKRDLEKLRDLALSGKINSENREDFLKKVCDLIDPESYDMVKLEEKFYRNRIFILDLMGKDVLIDSPKQIIKK